MQDRSFFRQGRPRLRGDKKPGLHLIRDRCFGVFGFLTGCAFPGIFYFYFFAFIMSLNKSPNMIYTGKLWPCASKYHDGASDT